MLLDRSGAVADPADALARVRALLADGVPTRVIAFDSAATTALAADVAVDSLQRDSVRATATGSVTAALVAARRLAPVLAAQSDSVSVLVSPLVAIELDAATDSVRARWPGRIAVTRVAARTTAPPDGRWKARSAATTRWRQR